MACANHGIRTRRIIDVIRRVLPLKLDGKFTPSYPTRTRRACGATTPLLEEVAAFVLQLNWAPFVHYLHAVVRWGCDGKLSTYRTFVSEAKPLDVSGSFTIRTIRLFQFSVGHSGGLVADLSNRSALLRSAAAVSADKSLKNVACHADCCYTMVVGQTPPLILLPALLARKLATAPPAVSYFLRWGDLAPPDDSVILAV